MDFFKQNSHVLCGIAAATVSFQSSAGIITFTDRSAFLAEIGTPTLHRRL